MTALYDALRAGEIDQARALLRAGADPNRGEPIAGERPLQAAIEGAPEPQVRYGAVRELLAYGADPRQRDDNGTGALYLALMYRDARILELLLRHGAEPANESGPGDRSLFVCALQEYCLDVYPGLLPEMLGEVMPDDPDTLVECLDRRALEQRQPRPECLHLLRLYDGGWS